MSCNSQHNDLSSFIFLSHVISAEYRLSQCIYKFKEGLRFKIVFGFRYFLDRCILECLEHDFTIMLNSALTLCFKKIVGTRIFELIYEIYLIPYYLHIHIKCYLFKYDARFNLFTPNISIQ